MKFSANEIQQTCYKAYLGLHRKNGEADKIPLIVSNNEMLGLPGVISFAQTLKHLNKNNALPIDLNIDKNKVVVDLKQCSVVETIALLLERMIDMTINRTINMTTNMTQSDPKVTLHINNVYNRWLCVGALVELVKNFPSVHVVANWTYAAKNCEIICVFQAGDIYPNIYCKPYEPSDNHADRHADKQSDKHVQTLTIQLSQKIISEHCAPIMYCKETLKKNHQQNIANGITVNNEAFKIIQQFAALILVEETEDSYKNAGE